MLESLLSYLEQDSLSLVARGRLAWVVAGTPSDAEYRATHPQVFGVHAARLRTGPCQLLHVSDPGLRH